MIVIGIDIGIKGCMSIIEYKDNKPILLEVIPYNIKEWRLKLCKYNRTTTTIIVEQIASKIGNSMQSVFSFGERKGELNTLLLLFSSRCKIVYKLPKVWQKELLGEVSKDKKEIKEKVSHKVFKIFKNQKELFMLKRKDKLDYNKTDSIGIALSHRGELNDRKTNRRIKTSNS